LGRFGSKGWILAHWASVSSRPYRAIRPLSGAAHLHDPPPTKNSFCKISPLYRVLKRLLGRTVRYTIGGRPAVTARLLAGISRSLVTATKRKNTRVQ
jgi:hypothetical protein